MQSKPSQNQMKRSKRIAENLNKIINLRTQPTASALELTPIEEDENENEFNNDQFIDQLPQPTHSSPVPCTSYNDYQDDCVTAKTSKTNRSKSNKETSPVTKEQKELSSSSSSTPSPIATSTDDEGAVETTHVSQFGGRLANSA